MAKSSKRRRAKPEQNEYEFECGKCKNTVTVKENETVNLKCEKCDFTGFNIFRLLSEEEAELEEKKKELITLQREEYDEKIANLQMGVD